MLTFAAKERSGMKWNPFFGLHFLRKTVSLVSWLLYGFVCCAKWFVEHNDADIPHRTIQLIQFKSIVSVDTLTHSTINFSFLFRSIDQDQQNERRKRSQKFKWKIETASEMKCGWQRCCCHTTGNGRRPINTISLNHPTFNENLLKHKQSRPYDASLANTLTTTAQNMLVPKLLF